jgi:hypothetical protein
MAWIVGDGFDYYGIRDDVVRGVWDGGNVNNYALTATTRFNQGQALTGGVVGLMLQKNCGNEPVLYLVFAYYRSGLLSGTTADVYFSLRDAGTAQCTVVLESSGNIVLKSGIQTGTVLATYTGAFPQDVWCHFQIRIAISATAGSMTVRKNGQTSDTYASATNLNTRGGTANAYANSITINTGSTATFRLDDVLMYSEAGAAPNGWVGDVRAVCLMPVADGSVKQFLPAPGDTSTFGTGNITGSNTPPANTLFMWGVFTPGRGGVVQKLTCQSLGAATGHWKAAIYASDVATNLPTALLTQSAEITTIPASGVNFDFTFPPGTSVDPSLGYFFAILGDASLTLRGASGAQTILTLANTYAAGFPNPAPTMTVGSGTLYGLIAIAASSVPVSELLANGDTDFNYSGTVGERDLYELGNLQGTPVAIVAVATKGFIKKSDAGARSGQVLLKSGATEVAGPDTVLSSTYTYLQRIDPTDPNTGTAWTITAVNALQVGQKVTL